MKLIIDIPEETYEHSKELVKTGYEGGYEAIGAIAHGIPLEDVKAEIEAYKKHPLISKEETYCLNWVLNMLEKNKE